MNNYLVVEEQYSLSQYCIYKMFIKKKMFALLLNLFWMHFFTLPSFIYYSQEKTMHYSRSTYIQYWWYLNMSKVTVWHIKC